VKKKMPSLLEFIERVVACTSSVRVTFAPGTRAPCASTTVPETEPEVTWACNEASDSHRQSAAIDNVCIFDLIVPLKCPIIERKPTWLSPGTETRGGVQIHQDPTEPTHVTGA